MLNQILAMTWKDLKIFSRDPGALILTLVQPLMFILIMTYAMTGVYRTGDRPIELYVANEDPGKQAAAVIAQLEKTKGFRTVTTVDGKPLDRVTAEGLVRRGKASLALVFPPDFSQALERGVRATEAPQAKLILIVDPATPPQFVEPVAGTLQGILTRIAFTALTPHGLDYLFERVAPGTPASQRESLKRTVERSISGGAGGMGTPVTIERRPPSGMRAEKRPDSFQQNVPGYTIYGLFWIVSLLAVSVVREKKEGTFRRLIVAPVTKAALLAGKVIPYFCINLFQLALVFAVATLLMGMKLGHSPMGLLLVSLATAAAATGLGVLVAAFARTEAQASSLPILILLSLSALGGCFVPRFIMPARLQLLSLITPHAWALDAYQDLLVRGSGLVEVLPQVAVLAGFAALFFLVGIWRFRFD